MINDQSIIVGLDTSENKYVGIVIWKKIHSRQYENRIIKKNNITLMIFYL